jgi:2-amino-4-hydroxy-6-hydroxymethyldihydropteridine diphosphokinase
VERPRTAGAGAGARRTAYLGLGSNLGDRRRYLRGAVRELRRLVDADLVVSPVYETAPVGGPPGQEPYLNCVVRLQTDLSARALLQVAGVLEAAAGRLRTVPNGPRTLDVDILLVEGAEVREPDLVVPHPRLRERAFVLAPLEDLDPDLVPAGWRERLGGSEAVDDQVRLVGTLFDS